MTDKMPIIDINPTRSVWTLDRQYEDIRVTVDGVNAPRFVEINHLTGASCTWFYVESKVFSLDKRVTRRKLAPMSRAAVRAAVKRIPETVCKK